MTIYRPQHQRCIRVPVRWSDALLTRLKQEYEQALDDAADLRARLLLSQLKAASGLFVEADSNICEFLSVNDGVIEASEPHILEEILWTLFVVQRFDLVCTLLRKTASLTDDIDIVLVEDAVFWGIELRIVLPRPARFVFSNRILQNDAGKIIFVRFVRMFSLFAEYLKSHSKESGLVTISLGDDDLLGGVGFSTRLSEAFLIPDCYFVESRGYEIWRAHFAQQATPWRLRHPVALWRGSTTGDPQLPSYRWRELPRIRLCEIARSDAARGLIDAGIEKICQVSDPAHVSEIVNSGYVREWVPSFEFQKWKYQIDIDGNTNSWPGLFMKLLTGSPVLKVTSPRGFRQWYYHKLKPWDNYIPVSSDLSDLVERIEWLRGHDDVACEIGRQGKLLVDSLDYEGELRRAAHVISAATRCSSAGGRRGFYRVTPTEVEMAYRLILGRDPENQDVIFQHATSCGDLDELRLRFVSSDEFQSKNAAVLQ